MAEGDPLPWYSALPVEDLPYIASKGWDKLDAPAAALAALNSYRGLEKLHGDLSSGGALRLPKDGDPASMKEFWSKLGTPADKAGYQFSDLKYTDGSTIDDGFADALREAAVAANMPASMLKSFVSKLMPHIEEADKTGDAGDAAASIKAQQELQAEWGPLFANNKFKAAAAMNTLGVPAEAVQALEATPGIGYKWVMNHFLKLGEMLGEARFVSGMGGQLSVTTPAGAQEQLDALMSNPAWLKDWRSGDKGKIAEKSNLIRIITGGGR